MGRGEQLSDERIEMIKAAYAESGSLRATARAAGVSVGAAKKYATNQDEFERLRTEKRITHIERAAEIQALLLEDLANAAKRADASLKDIATAYGIVTDKLQLLTGKATERHEHTDTSEARERITRRIDELADRRRARELTATAVGE